MKRRSTGASRAAGSRAFAASASWPQHDLGVAEDRDVGDVVAVDLGRIDVDLDVLGALARPHHRRVLLEAAADGEDDVGALAPALVAGSEPVGGAAEAADAERERDGPPGMRSCR